MAGPWSRRPELSVGPFERAPGRALEPSSAGWPNGQQLLLRWRLVEIAGQPWSGERHQMPSDLRRRRVHSTHQVAGKRTWRSASVRSGSAVRR